MRLIFNYGVQIVDHIYMYIFTSIASKAAAAWKKTRCVTKHRAKWSLATQTRSPICQRHCIEVDNYLVFPPHVRFVEPPGCFRPSYCVLLPPKAHFLPSMLGKAVAALIIPLGLTVMRGVSNFMNAAAQWMPFFTPLLRLSVAAISCGTKLSRKNKIKIKTKKNKTQNNNNNNALQHNRNSLTNIPRAVRK